jgi:hydroxymethylglutaryl-CoA reductase
MTNKYTSRLEEFYKKSIVERRDLLKQNGVVNDLSPLVCGGMDEKLQDSFIENAIGQIGVPVGVAANFIINDKEYIIPMAVEEPSVIAAASNAAKIVRASGGYTATLSSTNTTAQIELLGDSDKIPLIIKSRDEIISIANKTQPKLVELCGGVVDVEIREAVGSKDRTVVHLVVNCLDAMGANMVNTMAEAVAPYLAKLTGCRVGLKILTNLATSRVATSTCKIKIDNLQKKNFSSMDIARGIVAASDFALADPFRAATHNKGLFNGIDPVLLATGNDWRAVEAGGHAYACKDGQYGPLAVWKLEGEYLIGKIELPMAVGIVGGASRAHPAAASCLKMMRIETAKELAEVAITVGLASNMAALMALSTEGIQAGHMRLHNKRT